MGFSATPSPAGLRSNVAVMKRVAAFLILAVVISGCGGGNDPIGADPSQAGVEEVVRAGTTATFKGDWSTVHSLLTDECQAEYGVGDVAATLTTGLALVAGFLGLEPDELASLEVGDVEVFDLVEGQSARAVSSLEQVFFAMDSESEATAYEYQGGRWRTTECDFGDDFWGDDEEASELLDDGVELRPADEVEAEEILANAQTAELGEPFELAAGLTIAVTAMEVRGDDAGPWLAVTARVENRTADELSVPGMAILCDGSAEEGGWQAGSTLALYDSLPSGSFLEGVVHLLLPYDGRYGEPRVACADPAVVKISAWVASAGDRDAVVEVPADLVAALNAWQ